LEPKQDLLKFRNILAIFSLNFQAIILISSAEDASNKIGRKNKRFGPKHKSLSHQGGISGKVLITI
jgi:hypothetical protein